MKKPTKEQIVADLKNDLKRKPTHQIYAGSAEHAAYPDRWMPAVLIRKATIRRILELLK
jgi:hypothetical protein